MCSVLPTWCFDSTLDRCVDAWKLAGRIGWRVACSRPRGTAVVGSPYSSRPSELVTGPRIRLAGEELFKLRIPEILGKSFLARAPSGGEAWVGAAADPVDGGAEVRLAGPVSAAEQGPRGEHVVVGVVHQAGDDPSPRALGCGPGVPLSKAGGRPTDLAGQTMRSSINSPIPTRLFPRTRRRFT